MCKPELAEVKEKKCTLIGAYNPMVVIKVPDSDIVTNDLSLMKMDAFI